jgi:UDP-N-acetylmuramoylalanine--D-glutamate ligase
MNIMGAVLAALNMGCGFEDVANALKTYQLPHHRIEHICTLNGVEFIDDSKATNPHAGMAALAAIDKATVLIVGGVDKGLSLTAWIDDMQKNVRQIMLIGALTERFLREAKWGDKPCPITCCATLEEAVARGYDYAKSHGCEVVMLSPGCSSYDMFKSYTQRGDVFANAARSLK